MTRLQVIDEINLVQRQICARMGAHLPNEKRKQLFTGLLSALIDTVELHEKDTDFILRAG